MTSYVEIKQGTCKLQLGDGICNSEPAIFLAGNFEIKGQRWSSGQLHHTFDAETPAATIASFLRDLSAAAAHLANQLDPASADLAALRAENDRLRAELARMAANVSPGPPPAPPLPGAL